MDKLRAATETLKSVGADDESILVLVDTVSAKFAHISAILIHCRQLDLSSRYHEPSTYTPQA